MSDEFHHLAQVTGLAFEAERARVRAFAERESALRADIARLDQHKAELANLPVADLHGARATGLEIAWSAWHDRKRLELMRRLALHLAGKEAMLARLRRAYGRQQSAEDLHSAECGRRRAKKARSDEDARLAQIILSRSV